MRSPVASSLALLLATALLPAATAEAQPPAKASAAWEGCCGLTPWPAAGSQARNGGVGGELFGGYRTIVEGSTVRHHIALNGAIPAPYAGLRNPLPPTPETAQRGAAIYQADCASCHGDTGLADGAGSRTLHPPPAQLGWLAKVRTSRRDALMYWTIAEGGQHLKTDMPAYKGKLTDEEIWSVIGYIRGRLPKAKAATRAYSR